MLNSLQDPTASQYDDYHRGQMLKQVQHERLLWAIIFCYIEEQIFEL